MHSTQVRFGKRRNEHEEEATNISALPLTVHLWVRRNQKLRCIERQEIVPLSNRKIFLERCRQTKYVRNLEPWLAPNLPPCSAQPTVSQTDAKQVQEHAPSKSALRSFS